MKYRVAFELLYFCGLRRGELLALTWKHINFDTNELSIKQNLVENRLEGGYLITSPKTRSSIRTIPLFNKLVEDLKELKEKDSFDTSIIGTIEVMFKDGSKEYVSRRRVKDVMRKIKEWGN